MPKAKLKVRLPENTWIHEVSTGHPAANFSVLAAMLNETSEKGVGLVEIKASEREVREPVDEMSENDEITELELLQNGGGEALVQFETTNPLILFAAKESGVPLETPFDISDGVAEWEINAPHRKLSQLGDRLESLGIPFEVEYVREIESEDVLTRRQKQLMGDAVEKGYYDTPRRCSLTELAESQGIAKSTCSEILHRAEGKIVKNFAEDAR